MREQNPPLQAGHGWFLEYAHSLDWQTGRLSCFQSILLIPGAYVTTGFHRVPAAAAAAAAVVDL